MSLDKSSIDLVSLLDKTSLDNTNTLDKKKDIFIAPPPVSNAWIDDLGNTFVDDLGNTVVFDI